MEHQCKGEGCKVCGGKEKGKDSKSGSKSLVLQIAYLKSKMPAGRASKFKKPIAKDGKKE